MLVIFSDIHLTDGSTAINVRPDAFEKVLHPEIITASKENNSQEIIIILLGDIFDLVRTDFWIKLPVNQRPWGGKLDPKTAMNSHPDIENKYIQVLENIFKTESAISFFKVLNDIKDTQINKLVKIIYIIGNHDRAFNNFISLKQMFIDKLTSYSKADIDFPENNIYCDIEKYSTLCKHGHEFDKDNFGFELYKNLNNDENISRFDSQIYKVQSIGEVITGELISGIIHNLRINGADDKFINIIKDVNNVRPLSKALIWLYWYEEHSPKTPVLSLKNKRKLIKALKVSLNSVLSCKLAEEWDKTKIDLIFWSDLNDKLSKLRKVINNTNLNDIQVLIDIFELFTTLCPSKEECLEAAKRLFSMPLYEEVQFILMGHTHEALQYYLAGKPDETVKLYINTGTFLPYIEMAQNNKDFIKAFKMTMAFIYSADEDIGKVKNRPSLDLWNGIKIKKYIN